MRETGCRQPQLRQVQAVVHPVATDVGIELGCCRRCQQLWLRVVVSLQRRQQRRMLSQAPFLVVGLRGVESLAHDELRSHRSAMLPPELLRTRSCHRQLLLVGAKQLGSILRVRRRERIVPVPEQPQQRLVADDRGVERELDCLGVITDVAVGGRWGGAPRVPDLRAKDPV